MVLLSVLVKEKKARRKRKKRKEKRGGKENKKDFFFLNRKKENQKEIEKKKNLKIIKENYQGKGKEARENKTNNFYNGLYLSNHGEFFHITDSRGMTKWLHVLIQRSVCFEVHELLHLVYNIY